MSFKYRYLSVNGLHDVRNHGGTLTIYSERNKDLNIEGYIVINYGYSWCSKNDVFDKLKGRVLAESKKLQTAVIKKTTLGIERDFMAHIYSDPKLPFAASKFIKQEYDF